MSSAGGAPGAGTVACWGLNHLGRTNVPAGLRGVTHVTAGSSYTCAGTGDGALTCWGATGDGPASVPAGMTGVAQVSTLESHTCAVTIAGGVACWGRGFSGQTTVPAPYALTLRVAPAGAFGVAPAAPAAGEPVTLTLDGAQVPGYPAATTFTYAFDCGDGQGYGAFGAAATRTCPAAGAGPRTFRGAVRD